MTVGFVNAGLLSLVQAIGVIFGANIGTTITGQIVSLKLDNLAKVSVASFWMFVNDAGVRAAFYTARIFHRAFSKEYCIERRCAAYSGSFLEKFRNFILHEL